MTFHAADSLRSRIAIHLGHLTVHEQQVIIRAFERNKNFLAGFCDVHAVAHSFQQTHGDLPIDRVIFGEQDVQATVRARNRGGRRGRERSGIACHWKRDVDTKRAPAPLLAGQVHPAVH